MIQQSIEVKTDIPGSAPQLRNLIHNLTDIN